MSLQSDQPRTRRPRIAVIGDTYVDIQTQVPSLPEWGTDTTVDAVELLVGGSATNTARHLKGLGFDIKLFSAIGNDEFAAFLRRELAAEDLNLEPTVVSLPCATCACLVLSGRKDRAFVSCNAAAAQFKIDMIDREELKGVDHVHFGGYFNCTGLHTDALAELFNFVREQGATISVDPQFDASGRWTGENGNLAKVLPLADYFLASDAEARGISGESTNEAALASLAAKYPSCTIVVRCGEHGALYAVPPSKISVEEKSAAVTPQPRSQSAFKVDVVDTTGAGDAFNAGFIYSLFRARNRSDCEDAVASPPDADAQSQETPILSSVERLSAARDIEEAMRLGCGAGSWSVTQNGACSAPLTAGELQRFMGQ